MFEYRQIIVRMRLGESNRALAKDHVVSRNKAKAIRKVAQAQGWLDTATELPEDSILLSHFEKTVRSSTTSLSNQYESDITKWVEQGIQATAIFYCLKTRHDFTGSYNSVQRYVKNIKSKITSQVPTTILDFEAGVAAQVDFGQGPKIIDVMTGESFKTWVFVMVLCWSRHQYIEFVVDQSVETWLGCHRRAFESFNGVPKKIILDNPKCAITKACYYNPEVQRAYADYAEGYGFLISPCPVRDPQKKGIVESGVKYVKKNFVPLKEFRSLADANEQAKEWVLNVAGNRTHGTTRQKPLQQFSSIEQVLLKPLPEHPPEIVTWRKVKLHGDCHIQFQKCRYSAPFSLVGKTLWLCAAIATVCIYNESNVLVASHARMYSPGKRRTVDDHLPPNAVAFKSHDVQWCLEQSIQIGVYCHATLTALFNDKVLDNLRCAQGIVSLKNKYGALRLNEACKRALEFEIVNLRSIKTILIKRLEEEQQIEKLEATSLKASYTGSGKFGRNLTTIVSH